MPSNYFLIIASHLTNNVGTNKTAHVNYICYCFYVFDIIVSDRQSSKLICLTLLVLRSNVCGPTEM